MAEHASAYETLPLKYPPLSDEDLEKFLDGKWIAYLATTGKDGAPHVKPIWYAWDGEAMWMATWLDCKTTRNIEHESRVAVTLQEGGEPVVGFPDQGLILFGEAELIPEIKTENDPNTWHFKVFARYLGEEACMVPPLSEHLGNPAMSIKIVPNRIVSWDYRKGPIEE
jgi:general stress protein 26